MPDYLRITPLSFTLLEIWFYSRPLPFLFFLHSDAFASLILPSYTRVKNIGGEKRSFLDATIKTCCVVVMLVALTIPLKKKRVLYLMFSYQIFSSFHLLFTFFNPRYSSTPSFPLSLLFLLLSKLLLWVHTSHTFSSCWCCCNCSFFFLFVVCAQFFSLGL